MTLILPCLSLLLVSGANPTRNDAPSVPMSASELQALRQSAEWEEMHPEERVLILQEMANALSDESVIPVQVEKRDEAERLSVARTSLQGVLDQERVRNHSAFTCSQRLDWQLRMAWLEGLIEAESVEDRVWANETFFILNEPFIEEYEVAKQSERKQERSLRLAKGWVPPAKPKVEDLPYPVSFQVSPKGMALSPEDRIELVERWIRENEKSNH